MLSLQDQLSHVTAHFELVLGKFESLDSKFDFICSKVDGLCTEESNPPYSPRAFNAMSAGGWGSGGI